MRSTRADHEPARQGAREPQETERRLSAAEQRWLLEEFIRRHPPAAAADAVANPREHAPVIQRNDPARATAAAPARSPGLREDAPHVAVVATPSPGERETNERQVETLPPHTAVPAPAASPVVTPFPGPRLAATEGPGYRAVFACARVSGDDSTEE